MKEYYKEKIRNLVTLRTNLFTSVIVLTSGIAGLFFVNLPFAKILPFIFIGGYFDFIFFQNLISVNRNIDLYIEELKQ